MDVYADGKRLRLDPSQAVGKGGEADVYRVDDRTVAKVFKQPDHPDYEGNPAEAEAARRRIEEHQKKLREFPRLVGERVVAPIALLTDRTGQRIVGYTMEFIPKGEVLLRWSERSFRGADPDQNEVAEIFRKMHGTVQAIHAAGIVIGDFNDLNVLVNPTRDAWFIDADSFQWGDFHCRLYTDRFVDPLLCDQRQTRPVLTRPHGTLSDWYAFNVMLFRSLVLCDPYGGVYRPRGKAKDVPHTARPLHRITVFNKDVRYPKPAIPFDRLPDSLLAWFHVTFEEDARREFPVAILGTFRWTKCTGCGTGHGRPTCPSCQKAAPAAVKETVQVRGKVTVKRIFRTTGEILHATVQSGTPRWVYKEGTAIHREDDSELGHGLQSGARWRIKGTKTLYGPGGRVATLGPGPGEEDLFVDSYRNLPMFDANESTRFWLQGGVLMKDGPIAPERVGDVLENQTLFWVGPTFGFGFYRAGELSVAFVFDADKGGLNDGVRMPPVRGLLIDATCAFSKDLCWAMTSTRHQGRTINRCAVIKPDGTVVATAEGEEGDGSWLSGIRGKCAAAGFLLAVTDDGIVRVEPRNGGIMKAAEFKDTEPFVDTECQLLPGKDGVYVVDRQEIRLLKIG